MTDTDRRKQPATRASTARRTTTLRRRLGGTLGVLALTAGLAACGDGPSDEAASSPSPSASASASPSAQPSTAPSPAPSEAAEIKPRDLLKISCEYRKDDSGTPAKFVGLPPSKLTRSVILAKTMTIKTNLGNIVIDLDTLHAPCAVNSFAFLAKKNYFDNTKCHRLATVETVGLGMLQCGDPLATADGKRKEDGSGGPGYLFNDENLGGSLGRGAVGLAQASEDANSNGSQFFISFSDENNQLLQAGTAFSMIGTVSKGMNIVDKIAKGGIIPFNGDPTADVRGEGSNAPKMKVVIRDVVVS